MSPSKPRIAVVYDQGAVSPWDIGVGLADLGEILFLVPGSEHVADVRPVLGGLGRVVPLSGDTSADGAELRALDPAGIVTFSEPMLRTTARLAAEASLPFHDLELVKVLTNKVRQRQVLRDAGVDDLPSHPLRSPADWPAALRAVGLPAIIKPVTGSASTRTFAISDAESGARVVEHAFAGMRPQGDADEPVFIAERRLLGRPTGPFGDFVSVESMCTPSGVTNLAITGKLPLIAPFRESGHMWPSALSADETAEVFDLTARAVRALGVRHGVTHTEIKLTPEGPRIIEVNGRLGGWINGLSNAACGVDMVRICGRLALGEDFRPPDMRPDKVHFQYHCVAPLRPCRVEAIRGHREVLAISDVDGCRSMCRAGDELPGGVASREIFIVWGTAADHDQMARAVARIVDTMSFTFRFGDGVRTMTAADLRTEPFTTGEGQP